MMPLSKKTALFAGLFLVVSYGLSYATARTPALNGACAVVIVLVAAAVFFRSFQWGTAIVLGELVGGSLGRLFVLPGGMASVRMGLFAVAMLGTLWHVLRNAERRNWLAKRFLRGNINVFFVALVLLIGLDRGLMHYPASTVIADANAYAFLLLAPTIALACREEADRGRLLSVVLGAASAVSLLSLLSLFLFTHGVAPNVASTYYRWIRDFGLGEATPTAGFVRVFFQAHFWTMVVAVWSAVILACRRERAERWLWVVGLLCTSAVLLSFSRTLWVATGGAVLLVVVSLATVRALRPTLVHFVVTGFVLVVVGAALPFVISRGSGSAAIQRITVVSGEAAADSRLNLLNAMWPVIRQHPVIGWGFGKSLTYVTRDPRLLAYFPDGNYTTTAFEWGWLDMWIKLGLFGVIIFFFWVMGDIGMALRVASGKPNQAWALALAATTLAVGVAHIFSPWLNHPLGLGYLMLATAILDRMDRGMINVGKKQNAPSGNPASLGANQE